MSQTGDVAGDTTATRSIHVGIAVLNKGGTAPTDVIIGTTPEVPALLFDSVGETVSLGVLMPEEWDKDQDISLQLLWSLVNAETNNDTLDITCDYIAIEALVVGGGPAKTSSQATGQVTVTTANGLAVDTAYGMTIDILASDLTNGFSSGDQTIGFVFEVHLTNTTGVSAAHLIAARMSYEALY